MTRPPNEMLLTAPVERTLLRLAFPMVAGIGFALVFNLVDTLYVAQLGARELAALSFTFPVALVFINVCMGLGAGAASAVARALGEGDLERVRRLATGSLILSASIVGALAVLGIVSIRPTFALLGAPADLLPLIESYMLPWYLGVSLLTVPMVGNGAVRATGDTLFPSLIMGASGFVNIALDPLLIFGLGPFPRLELEGAACASVLSWFVVVPPSLWILGWREHFIELGGWTWKKLRAAFGALLHVGAPVALTNVFVPLAGGMVTRILAEQGAHAVAAYGVGQRIESLAMVGVFALATAVSPVVGQSYGAGKGARILETWRAASRIALVYALAVSLVLAAFASFIARWFSSDSAVVLLITRFQELVPLSLGLAGVSVVMNTIFNSMGLPFHALVLIVLRLFVLTVPLAYLGAHLGGTVLAFAGIAVANCVTGAVTWGVARRFLRVRGSLGGLLQS